MTAQRLRYIWQDVDRHGNVRVYFVKRGHCKVRLTEPVGSPEFLARYAALLSGDGLAEAPRAPSGPALRGLVSAYVSSPAYARLDPRAQRVRRQILEHCCREPIAPGSRLLFADMPLPKITPKAVLVLRDRKARAAEAGNGRVKALRQLFRWAVADGRMPANPALEIGYLPRSGDGFHTWSIEQVEQFEARWPLGSKPRLALAILLYTGLRRSDAVILGRQHARDGVHRLTLFKGRKRSPVSVDLPILPELAEAIAAGPCGDLTYLVTEFGRPFTAAGFGNWFREQCDAAGLKGCSANGLRKAGATIAADNGATAHHLMAIFGWQKLAQAEVYTRKAGRKRLARDGMGLLQRRGAAAQTLPLSKPGGSIKR